MPIFELILFSGEIRLLDQFHFQIADLDPQEVCLNFVLLSQLLVLGLSVALVLLRQKILLLEKFSLMLSHALVDAIHLTDQLVVLVGQGSNEHLGHALVFELLACFLKPNRCDHSDRGLLERASFPLEKTKPCDEFLITEIASNQIFFL